MEDESWIDLAVAVCAHADIEYRSIETLATWDQYACANAVYRLDDQRYLKVYGPTAERQFHVERSILQTLKNYNTVPAPHIVAEGEPAQYPPYLIMLEIPGSTAENVWVDLSRFDQLAIARELGEITAAIHCLPQQDLAVVEQQFGGWREHVEAEQARQFPHIEATENISLQRRNDMIRFMKVEAQELLNSSLKVTHCELAHNHIYLSQDMGTWKVTGLIDWADAMLGPPEWDVAFLWFWTFSRDREAMRVCLQTLYADNPPPERFARRCLAAILHTHSMPSLWAEFAERGTRSNPIEIEMTKHLFPSDVFGSLD